MSLGPLHSTRSGVTATFSFLTLSACGAGPVSPQRMTSLKIHTWSQAAYLPGSRTAWASSSGGENTALAWPGAERTKYWDYLLCNRVLFLFEKGKTGCTQGDSLSLKASQIWPWHCLVVLLILLAEVSASFTLLSVTLMIAMPFPPSTPNPLCTGIKCCMPNDFQHTNCTFYLYQLVVLA